MLALGWPQAATYLLDDNREFDILGKNDGRTIIPSIGGVEDSLRIVTVVHQLPLVINVCNH